MASTTLHLLHVTPLRQVRNAHPTSCKAAHSPKPAPFSPTPSRRHCLLLLTSTAAAIKAAELPAKAEDIGLFGIRKRIKKAEEQVEEAVKEGIESAEKELETVEEEAEAEAAILGPVGQAAVVAGAELGGVLVATSVVNAILGPEGQKI